MRGIWGIFFIAGLSLMLGLFSVTALAAPNENASDTAKEKSKFSIPKHAVKIAEGVYDLGKGKDVNGKPVQGFMFVDFKENSHKPTHNPGQGNGKGNEQCFSFAGKGAKLKVIEPWIANTANDSSLTVNEVFSALDVSVNTWEAEIGNQIGAGSTTNEILVADTRNPDGVNEVYFASISEPGVVAFTIFFTTNGKPSEREIVEWDQVYDDDRSWAIGSFAGAFDLQNIATHEMGHSFGMGHPNYVELCENETMYGIVNTGETKKRDLSIIGDIPGIQQLYG